MFKGNNVMNREFLPSVSHYNHAELVSEVLHLVDLNKSPCAVNSVQILHNIRLITDNIQNKCVVKWPFSYCPYETSALSLTRSLLIILLQKNASIGLSQAHLSPQQIHQWLILHLKRQRAQLGERNICFSALSLSAWDLNP